MTNEINLEGNDNIVVQDSEYVNITVNNILSKSHDYNTMLGELSDQQEVFDGIPEDNLSLRLKVSAKINELTNRIKQFKQEIRQLAETFDKLEVNSERLQQAREFFEKGEIGEARALLNDANEEIAAEEDQLWRKREQYQTEIEPKLIAKSEERYLQALLSRTDYANPNWFADTCNYFELSIKSYPTKYNLFQFALFLQEHNQFADAEKYYSKYLKDFSNQISENEYAMTLNNLANLHSDQNRYDEALSECEEALTIYRKLAETNLDTYLPFVATTLNNLANLHKNQNRYDEALSEYEEALAIRRKLAETNPNTFLPDVAATLNNLANLHSDQNRYDEALSEYEEALAIYRKLAETNPNTFLPYVATTLNNLANLHSDQNQYDEALSEYEEPLAIYRKLAETNPNTFLPKVAMTLINLSIYFEESVIERGKSIEYVMEAILIVLPIVEKVPYTQRYKDVAMDILRDWNLSDDEIDRMIAERMKENE